MAPRWSLDGSTLAFAEEGSCSSSIVSGLSSSELQDERTDQRDEEENSLSTSISSTHHTKSVAFQELATIFLYDTTYNNKDDMESNASTSLSSSSASVQYPKVCNNFCGWYSNEELRSFKMDVVETVERIVSGEIGGGDNDFCSRGCEYRTPVGTILRQKHRRDGLEAVLGYQFEQRRRSKKIDPDLLARIYAAVARHSQTVANVMGNIDQSVIMQAPPSSPSLASEVDLSISTRIRHGVTVDCSKLEVEKVQQMNRQIEGFHLPSPPAFAFSRHRFHAGLMENN
jgi:hypothetical protein